MTVKNPKTGIALALVSLTILGVMPIISNSRPVGSNALSFAFYLSMWQVLFSLPLLFRELGSANKGIFSAHLESNFKKRTIAIILSTGVIFGLSTYIYVLAVEKAGAVNAAIAMQAYPLFAILLETIFLKRRKTPLELFFTATLLITLYYLSTKGTWAMSGLSPWFLLALAIPFLWSVAHIIIKEVLDRTPITPAQVTFFRVVVSVVFLSVVLAFVGGSAGVVSDFFDPRFQMFAALMGFVYYTELIVWFYAVRHIDVSLASTITVPWPALTMVLAIALLGDQVVTHQIVAFVIVAASVYGLTFAHAVKFKRSG